jgi:hypothetical protein
VVLEEGMFMKVWRKQGLVVLVLGLAVMAEAGPADASSVAADLTIQRVRLTDQRVLRIRATYVCPTGFAVQPALPPRAFASQQTETHPSSQSKKFSGIVCDGTRGEVLVRFVKPRHPHGAEWEFGALTQVSLTFQASTDLSDVPYFFVVASDSQAVIV